MTQVTSRRDPLTQRFARTVHQTVQHGHDWWEAQEPHYIAGCPPRPIRVGAPWWRRLWRFLIG
jgi:hypothetical protein